MLPTKIFIVSVPLLVVHLSYSADTMPTKWKLIVIAGSGKALFAAAVLESKAQTHRQMHVCSCFACGSAKYCSYCGGRQGK